MANPALKTTPIRGDYGCVSILWLKHKVGRWNVKLPNLLGYAIMLQTWSRYCHAFIYVGGGQIVQAQPGGANIASLSEYAGMEIVWSTDNLTDAERGTIVDTAFKCVKIGYGFLDIFAQALVNFGFNNKWLWARVEREDKLICSQLVAKCGWQAGWSAWLCGWLSPAQVTPAQLARRLATRPRNLVRYWRDLTRMLHIA